MSGGSIQVTPTGQALAVSILVEDTTRVPTVTVGSKTVTSMPYVIDSATTFVVAQDARYDVTVYEGDVLVYSVTLDLVNDETWNIAPGTEYVKGTTTKTGAIGSTHTIPSPEVYGASDVTLAANTTLTFPTPTKGKKFDLAIRQDQVGGRTVSWPTTAAWVTGSAPTLVTTVTSGNQNLLTANQSSVETNTTGLTSAAYATTTLARTTAGGTYENGSAAASLTPTGTVVVGVTTDTGVSGVAVTAGERYTAVASTKSASTAATFRVAIAWYAGATLLSTSVGPAVANNSSGWTQHTVSAAAPYSATYAAVKVYSGATTAVVHYVDSIGLWKTNVAPYLALSGSSGSYASTPDASPVSVTGDIDIRVKANLTDWTPSGAQDLVSKYGDAGNKSFRFYVDTDGTLNLATTAAGTTMLTATSSAAPTVSNAADLWVRATLDVDDGSSNHVVKFYTSADGATWTQLGTTQTVVGTNSIYNGTSPLEIGSNTVGTANNLTGRVYRATILSGIGTAGTTVFDADFTTQAGEYFQESSSYAAWVTVYGRATWAIGGASAVAPELLRFEADGTYWYGEHLTRVTPLTSAVTTAISDAKGLPVGAAGATVATRYVGSTAANAPASGTTWAVGDYVITSAGRVLVCTVASSGDQGTWVDAGTAAAAAVKGLPLALTGATSTTRYAGGTTTGAPASGTFALGDVVIAQTGVIYVCTTAGVVGSGCVFSAAVLPAAGTVETDAAVATTKTMGTVATYRAYDYTLADTVVITAPAAVAGVTLTVRIKQAAAGNKAVTWSGVQWAGGTIPTITATADKIDYLELRCVVAGDGWIGSVLGQNVSTPA